MVMNDRWFNDDSLKIKWWWLTTNGYDRLIIECWWLTDVNDWMKMAKLMIDWWLTPNDWLIIECWWLTDE